MKKTSMQTGRSSWHALSFLAAGTAFILWAVIFFVAVPSPSKTAAACTPAVKVTPQLDDVYAIEVTGTIRAPGVVDIGGEAPGLFVDSGTQSYPLTFTTNPNLQEEANNNRGQCVKLTGTLKKAGGIERPEREVIEVQTLIPVP